MKNFVTLLRSLVEDPDAPVSQAEILHEDEQHLLLEKFNATLAAYPLDRCIHELFEEECAKRGTTGPVTTSASCSR